MTCQHRINPHVRSDVLVRLFLFRTQVTLFDESATEFRATQLEMIKVRATPHTSY